MGFYSPTWVKKLLKEDSAQLVSYVSKRNSDGKYVNDFRDYVDANLPFVLWLSIQLIKERIIDKSRGHIRSILEETKIYKEEDIEAGVDNVSNMLIEAYKKLINSYIDNSRYVSISSKELEDRLNALTGAPVGSVKSTITKLFSRTMRVDTVSLRDRSVMLIFPKFTTVKAGSDLKEFVDFNLLGLGDPSYIDTPARIIKDAILSNNGNFFTKLQNIGHIEVDVLSTQDKTVKRGQSSPRLLQALVVTPNSTIATSRLQREFSKQTGQTETRVLVRKKFKKTKLVFELLVESGMSVGIPETQADNLIKASKELAFKTGAGLTAQIRKNPEIVIDLETSKSMKQFLLNELAASITGAKTADYNSTFTYKVNAPVQVPKIHIVLPKVLGDVSKAPTRKVSVGGRNETTSLLSLQALINANLRARIVANMGTGDDKRVLNYRSGRFADSVNLERLSQSRQGMVTAFYSYMKNPYATFSDGGQQQYPKSRDPKTLIVKSIKEIASKVIKDRLRAVLV